MKERKDKNAVKKPFYKKWWFWVIIVILLIGIFGSSGNKQEPDKTPETTEQTDTVTNTKETETTEPSMQTEAVCRALTEIFVENVVGEKYSMLDMCQLTNRLTEHKYLGAYEQLAQTVIRYSKAPYLDVQKFCADFGDDHPGISAITTHLS